MAGEVLHGVVDCSEDGHLYALNHAAIREAGGIQPLEDCRGFLAGGAKCFHELRGARAAFCAELLAAATHACGTTDAMDDPLAHIA